MFVLLLITMLVTASQGCPFFQMIPTNVSSTTNYTLLSKAMVAGMSNAMTIIVCDEAIVQANEILPVINSSLSIMGVNPVGTEFAYLTITNLNLDSVFIVNASNSDLVIFENLNIVYEKTLFSVVGRSQLIVTNLKCWFGETCISVNTGTVGLTHPGVIVDTVGFIANDIGILWYNGYITCLHCTFYDSLVAAVLLRNLYPTPTDYITMYDHHYINVADPSAQQTGPGQPLMPPLSVSAAYVDGTDFYNCQTYVILPLPNLNGAFGDFSNGTCPICPDCGTVNVKASAAGEVIGGGIVLVAILLLCVLYSRNKPKPKAYK